MLFHIPPHRPHRQLRQGFTLVEMLIVITISVTSISLIASGLFAVFKSADRAKISSDISQLANAVGAFKTQYQVPYLPSYIVLDETATSGGATNATSAFIQQIWPRINFTNGIDWNGDGTIGGPVTLQGNQCLVFFLGGIQGLQGFSTNPTNPAALGGGRTGPFFNFQKNRLDSITFGVPGFPAYLDPIGKPYAYYTAYTQNSYNNLSRPLSNDCAALGVLSLSTGPYFHVIANGTTSTTPYYNQQSFQIIFAGSDGVFGQGGQRNSSILPATAGLTDPYAIYTEPTLPKPGYLVPMTDPVFGSQITRIANDPLSTLTTQNVGSGTWGTLARHMYSTIQPWSSDGSLICIANTNADNTVNEPRQLYLDATTYLPKYGKPALYYPLDDRWHPDPAYATIRIATLNAYLNLQWWDIATGNMVKNWDLPFVVNQIGGGKGHPSNDGRYIALNSNNTTTNDYRMFVIDMQSGVIGPIYDLYADGQMQPGWDIDWVSVSPSGQFLIVMYANNGVDTALRVFNLDPTTLVLTPRPMSKLFPGMTGSPAQGFIYGLGHADMTIATSHNYDCIVGVENCGNVGKNVPTIPGVNGGPVGQLIMVQLNNGQVYSLDDPTNEAGPAHVSCRNINRPGWAYVSFYYGSRGAVGGARFQDEVVAVKLDGSGAVERLAHQHSDFNLGGYYAYPMACPNLDGSQVIFASNWMHNGTNGSETIYQGYILKP